MRPRNRIHALLALLAAASLPAAQDAKKTPAPTSGSGHTPAPVKEAGAKVEKTDKVEKADSQAIVLYVTGLTKDNQTQVKDALTAMSTQRYVCDACKHSQAEAGKCPMCKADLKSEKHPILSNVTVTPDASSVAITPSSSARLSEIEGALAKASVHLDSGRVAIPGKATLVLKEGAADNVTAIEKALKDAKLFDEVHATFDSTRHELDVTVRAGTTAPMRSAVAKAIEGAGTKAKLSDVVWGDMPKKT